MKITISWVVAVLALVVLITFLYSRQAKAMTIEEFEELCPAVDFSPMHPVCYRFRIRRTIICEEEDIDFSPPRPPQCFEIRTLCPDVDFSPQPAECLEDEDE